MPPYSSWMWSFALRARAFYLFLILLAGLLLPLHLKATGTWVALNNLAPNFIDTTLLLPDGTVMAACGYQANGTIGTNWYRLTPDSHGSYVNGTWSRLASMNYPRLYYSSQVLTNGQVFVAGGEYSDPTAFTGPGTTNAEIYNPISDTWTILPYIGANAFYDSPSEMLPSGNVLVSPVTPSSYGRTLIWNTANNNWTTGPNLYRGGDEDEASWVKLPDNSILTIDSPVYSSNGSATNSERYIPSLNQWINDATLPLSIYDAVYDEMGPALLLPDGRVFFVGGSGNSAFYTPSGTTANGSWAAGPALPGVAADAPGAMMVNGKALYVFSSSVYATNNYFYEYDYTANSFTPVISPASYTTNKLSFDFRMLDLPDGTVLVSFGDRQLFVYQPDGSPLTTGKPAINTLTTNGDGSYHLTGTLFNGITEGAGYGDDAQMNSNYPLVRMTNSVGQVFYARAYNWNSTGIMTGTNVVSTDFIVPLGLVPGTYSLVVVANGNASAPVSFVYFPDAMYVTSTNLTFSGTIGGPFIPSATSLTITNIGSASFNWAVGSTSSWLNVSSTSGALNPGGPAASILFTPTSAANNLPFGTYSATIWITNKNDNYVQSRTVTLQVNPVQLPERRI